MVKNKSTVQLIKHPGLPLIQPWLDHFGLDLIDEDRIPFDSSFLVSKNNKPYYFVSLVETNSAVAYVDNYVANPEVEPDPAVAVEGLKLLEEEAKQRGFKKMYCITTLPKLEQRYKDLGFAKVEDRFTLLSKEVV